MGRRKRQSRGTTVQTSGFNQRTEHKRCLLRFSSKHQSQSPRLKIIRINWNNNFNLGVRLGRPSPERKLQHKRISLAFSAIRLSTSGAVSSEMYFTREEFGSASGMRIVSGAFFRDPKRSLFQQFFGTFFRTQPSKKIILCLRIRNDL